MGETPYKESFDQKPPGVFVAYAAILRWVGTSPAAIHWATQVYTLGTLAVIFFLGRRLFSPLVGLLAAMLAAFMTSDAKVLGNSANTEVFMILPLAGGLLTALVAVERESFAWSFVTGMLATAALLFKQVAVVVALFYLLLIIWTAKRRWRLGAGMCLGGVALLVPCVAYFCLAGAWHEFYDCTIRYNLSYVGEYPLYSYPARFWSHFRKISETSWPIYSDRHHCAQHWLRCLVRRLRKKLNLS